MNVIDFEGLSYFDDRMFILHICECTVSAVEHDVLETTIFHDAVPPHHQWCIVTYRNSTGYPALRVDHFASRHEAIVYKERVEPTVPRVSLRGESPRSPLPYREFALWKATNGMKDYDYRQTYRPGGENHREIILSPKR